MNKTDLQSEAPDSLESVPADMKLENAPPNVGFVGKIRTFLATRVVWTVSVALLVSTSILGFSGANIWTIYQSFQETVEKQFRLQELSKDTTYLDEALTHSANMAASTGDLIWAERYDSFVPKLDTTIEEIIKNFPQAQAGFDLTADATDKLYALEDEVFKQLREGNQAAATAILFGTDYATHKNSYAQGVEKTLKDLQADVDKELSSSNENLQRSLILSAVGLLLVVMAWLVILSAIRTYVRDRNQAQTDLIASQESLRDLNEGLEARVEQRTQQIEAQEQAARQESEVLQEDVGALLDIVSAVEDGDLTAQAPVSDRVTGLVSDTFNRLVEQLSQVLSQVLGTAEQVTQGSLTLEDLATTVATNAQQQAEGVTEVLGLSEQVEQSAQISAERVNVANQSLSNVYDTVETGQEALTALNEGIAVLKQGTDHIVQQMKTLGEFVGLADQFVQEQGQIASLTQVLAMNAGLVAARAAEQRDPRQFLVVAREFEAIASQVSNLAQQTNDGLGALEQRTDQIHTVVTAIDSDVQGLNGLVSEFTDGVEQSNQIFTNIRSVTGEVVQAGESVAQSNQEIVQAARSTATAMRGIANLATQTAQLTQDARSQSEQMEALSLQLLQRVRFFQLPGINDTDDQDETLAASPAPAPSLLEGGPTIEGKSSEIATVSFADKTNAGVTTLEFDQPSAIPLDTPNDDQGEVTPSAELSLT